MGDVRSTCSIGGEESYVEEGCFAASLRDGVVNLLGEAEVEEVGECFQAARCCC